MTIQKGDKAPSFKLFNTQKKEISLEDFKGKNLIVHFFPAAFTGVCTQQMCNVRDAIGLYHNDRCDVVGISVDMPYTLGKFKELQNLSFDLLSDFNKEVSKAYGAQYETWNMNLKGVAKRAAFVIDGNGIIQYAQVMENASDMPDFAAINATLASLGVPAAV
ncbi:MAG: redoxin domain-containing protein [Bacteroidia bacterium]